MAIGGLGPSSVADAACDSEHSGPAAGSRRHTPSTLHPSPWVNPALTPPRPPGAGTGRRRVAERVTHQRRPPAASGAFATPGPRPAPPRTTRAPVGFPETLSCNVPHRPRPCPPRSHACFLRPGPRPPPTPSLSSSSPLPASGPVPPSRAPPHRPQAVTGLAQPAVERRAVRVHGVAGARRLLLDVAPAAPRPEGPPSPFHPDPGVPPPKVVGGGRGCPGGMHALFCKELRSSTHSDHVVGALWRRFSTPPSDNRCGRPPGSGGAGREVRRDGQ